MTTHLILPDCQVKPGVDMTHLSHISNFIMEKRPDVIVCLGDFADMASLSSYDKGKKSFEGRRYKKDIAAAKQGMDLLLKGIRAFNKKAAEGKKAQYKPRMVITLGNHEQRIERVADLQPELEGVIGYDDLPYKDWEVIPFLETVVIDGLIYTHYLANPYSGKPYGGSAANQLAKVGYSFVVGHKQTLEVTTRFALNGSQQWGIIAGACYTHLEDFKGPQGNNHWRGVILAEGVKDGSFNPFFVSLDYLRGKYESG
jgi:hypothetical protein